MSGKIISLVAITFFLVNVAMGHNQDAPTTQKAFRPLMLEIGAKTPPPNYLKSPLTENIDGKTVELYRVVSTDGSRNALLGKVEVAEVLYVIGVDATTKSLIGVSYARSKKLIPQSQIDEELKFVAPIAQGLAKLVDKK